MHIAACAGDHALYTALESAGVELATTDIHGRTAAQYLGESSSYTEGTHHDDGKSDGRSTTPSGESNADLGARGQTRDATARSLPTSSTTTVAPEQSRSMLLSVVLNRKAKQGDIAGVRTVLDKIPEHLSTIADYDLRTPLHLAAAEGNTDVSV